MNGKLTKNVLFDDIVVLINTTKSKVARTVNSSLVILYWKIGQRVNQEILNESRAEYGEKIIKTLAQELCLIYGKGFDSRSLFRMVRFAKAFPDEEIVATLSPLLSWSHFIELISIDDPLKRKFYIQICRLEHWTVRDLRKKIDGLLYERTAIAQQAEYTIENNLSELTKNDTLTQELVFRDPYVLDFLNLPSKFSEKDLENAILDELTKFLHELGTDFCFIARQKRIIIDNEDYYIDLLTYHRGLNRLIAIELKLGRFKAAHKGQMELYLRWLDKYERKSNEESPLGLILCSEKKHEHIELLELNKSGIHVSQYLTELPPKKVLEDKLHNLIKIAQEKYAMLEQNFNTRSDSTK
jgi:predicted nuclease of restriction endonuclease-like (RecB) superfamily